MIIEKATNPAIRTDRGNHFIGFFQPDTFCRHQGTRWTCLDTFSASDTGTDSHRIIQIEDNGGMGSPPGITDHIIHLFFTAGPDTTCTLDTGIEMDRNRWMAFILDGLMPLWKSGGLNSKFILPKIEFGIEAVRRIFLIRHVGQQKLKH